MKRPDTPLVVRANGGHLIHVLPATGSTALCGHQPANNPSRSMRSRGKWLYVGSVEEKGAAVSCPKCRTKLGELKC